MMAKVKTQFGLLLPHFGDHANYASVFDFSQRVEELGFHSVWVRDHLSFSPHGFEGVSSTFLEPFTTLAAIAARTTRLMLGTGVIIPFRHPLVTSQLFGTLSYVAKGRIIAGIGAGGVKKPFFVTGIPHEKRFAYCKEMVDILRLTWSGPKVSYKGEFFQFEDATIDPRPAPDTPIWYGGSSAGSVRRALEYCGGWFPGRCPLRTLDIRLKDLRDGAAAAGKRRMEAAIIPVVSIDKDRAGALAKINVKGLLDEAKARPAWKGPFETADDLEGILIAGSPKDCIREVQKLVDREMDVVVFDFRLTPTEYEQSVEILGREVLPAFR